MLGKGSARGLPVMLGQYGERGRHEKMTGKKPGGKKMMNIGSKTGSVLLSVTRSLLFNVFL